MPDDNNTNNDDPRFNALAAQMEEIRRQNALIFERLSSAPPKAEEPLPNVTGTEFLDNPVGHVDTVVDRRIKKLKDDIDTSLAPFAQFMREQAKEKVATKLIGEMEAHSDYKHIGNPYVKQMVYSALITADNINVQYANSVYLAAVGAAVTQGKLDINTTPPKDKPVVPAHIRPTGSDSGNGKAAWTLGDDERRIQKERGWSDARAAYAFGKISAEDYIKIEPNGKLIGGI